MILRGLRREADEPYEVSHDIQLDLDTVHGIAVRHRGPIESHQASLPLVHPSGLRRSLTDDPPTLVAGLAENNSMLALFGLRDDEALTPIAAMIREDLAAAGRRDCDVGLSMWCSSPGGVTPVHMDVNDVFLLQVSGTKMFGAGAIADRGRRESELRHRFCDAENMGWVPAIRREWELRPGVGAFLPAYTPHWALVGDEMSVALSVAVTTPQLRRREAIHQADATLFQRGLRLPAPGRSHLLDETRLLTVQAARRAARLLPRR